jgi:hypothetical protein
MSGADPLEIQLHDGPQTRALTTEATEILYGGAAGGGKSFLIRAAFITWASLVPGLQLYLFRRTFPELEKNHMQGPTSFPAMLAGAINDKRVKINYSKMQIHLENGSVIHLCHCQYEKNKYDYHGAEIHVLALDELTTFTSGIYYYLRSRVRMVGVKIPAYVRAMFPRLGFPRILNGSNPGGIGHTWVKADFVTSETYGKPWATPEDEGGMIRQFIPAMLDDNPTLLREDPGYYGRLSGLGSEAFVKALREGSWDILEGAMFAEVFDPAINVIPVFTIPRSWPVTRAFDWGSSKPFSVGWYARADGTQPTDETGESVLDYTIPRGSRIRIAEFYGWNGKPNQGKKLLPAQIARKILEHEKKLPILGPVLPGAADSAIYDSDRGDSIAKKMQKLGVKFKPSKKGPGSRVNGWEVMRDMLEAAHTRPIEDPALFVFENNRHFKRTIPELPRDSIKTDDIDTDAEDHIADECRYEITLPRSGGTRTKTLGV